MKELIETTGLARALRALAGFAWLVLWAAPLTAEVIEDVDVSLQPPPGFFRAQAFSGFQQLETFASIEIRELEIPFNALAPQLTAVNYATTNSLLVGSQAMRSGARDALLIELETELAGEAFNKWVYIIGDAFRSVTITASYPRWAAASMREPLKAAVLSAEWQRTPEEQLFFDLPFTAAESADLKFVKRSPTMLVLADLGDEGVLTPAVPSIVVGHLESEKELTDIKSISHAQLARLESLEILEIRQEGETKIDGIRSYQITASVRQKHSGSVHEFKQVLAFQQFRYLLVQASVEQAMAEEYLPQFDQVIASIAFK